MTQPISDRKPFSPFEYSLPQNPSTPPNTAPNSPTSQTLPDELIENIVHHIPYRSEGLMNLSLTSKKMHAHTHKKLLASHLLHRAENIGQTGMKCFIKKEAELIRAVANGEHYPHIPLGEHMKGIVLAAMGSSEALLKSRPRLLIRNSQQIHYKIKLMNTGIYGDENQKKYAMSFMADALRRMAREGDESFNSAFNALRQMAKTQLDHRTLSTLATQIEHIPNPGSKTIAFNALRADMNDLHRSNHITSAEKCDIASHLIVAISHLPEELRIDAFDKLYNEVQMDADLPIDSQLLFYESTAKAVPCLPLDDRITRFMQLHNDTQALPRLNAEQADRYLQTYEHDHFIKHMASAIPHLPMDVQSLAIACIHDKLNIESNLSDIAKTPILYLLSGTIPTLPEHERHHAFNHLLRAIETINASETRNGWAVPPANHGLGSLFEKMVVAVTSLPIDNQVDAFNHLRDQLHAANACAHTQSRTRAVLASTIPALPFTAREIAFNSLWNGMNETGALNDVTEQSLQYQTSCLFKELRAAIQSLQKDERKRVIAHIRLRLETPNNDAADQRARMTRLLAIVEADEAASEPVAD